MTKLSAQISNRVEKLARWVAILGGIVLSAVAIMSFVSIIGRAGMSLGLSPISGDYELLEAGTAFVITAFLPWCQLQRGHASVAILTDRLGVVPNLVIDIIADILMLIIAIILTQRHLMGTMDKFSYGETTFILQFPLWWAYAASLLGLLTWIIVGIWCLTSSATSFTRHVTKSGDVR